MIFSLPKADRDGVLATHTSPANRLGEYFCDNDTNSLWVYLRANSNLSRGMPLTHRGDLTYTSGLLSGRADSQRLTFGIDLSAPFSNVPARPQHCEYVIVRDIVSNEVGTVWSRQGLRSLNVEWWQDRSGDAFSADDDMTFVVPWLAIHADGNTGAEGVIGFVQTDVPSGNYFWALVQGVGIGLAATAVTIVSGSSLDVANTGNGVMTAVEATTNVSERCGFALTGSAAVQEFPIVAAAPNRISIPPLRGGHSNPAYQHPSTS